MSWQKFEQKTFAIVLFDYTDPNGQNFKLKTGEYVSVLAEANGWFKGKKVQSTEDGSVDRGVFPCSYVKIIVDVAELNSSSTISQVSARKSKRESKDELKAIANTATSEQQQEIESIKINNQTETNEFVEKPFVASKVKWNESALLYTADHPEQFIETQIRKFKLEDNVVAEERDIENRYKAVEIMKDLREKVQSKAKSKKKNTSDKKEEQVVTK
eukprot:c15951_g1_i1.p1 GENE.c15951_g1_i1~~c15951_g1_i1.p1  ORF type:complete len:215 (+),score=93.56 c15951_g1_i1:59-703(+)